MRSADVAEWAGITYRQLDHWTTQGYVHPTGDPKPGNGYQREYAPAEARVVTLMAELVRAGFGLPAAERGARDIAARGMTQHGRLVIVAAERVGSES